MGNTSSSAPRRGHLELAVSYTRDSWFPALPGATERLTALLQAPGGINREQLLAELKRDLAVVSALSRLILSTPAQPGFDGSLASLRFAPEETLRTLVNPAQIVRSKHTIDGLQSWQSSRLVETAVAVSAAHALSSSYDVEAELAYTCALLRQLGLSLLAWNYPHVFKRALSIIRPGESLDTTLGKILGFTPTLLTLTLLRSKEASPVILKTLGDTWVDSSITENDMTLVEKLSSLCRLSETLARATARGLGGSADPHWENSRAEFESRVGKNGWMILETELSWCLSAYTEFGVEGAATPRMIRTLSQNAAREVSGRLAQIESIAPLSNCRPESKRLLTEFLLRALAPGGREAGYQFLLGQVIERWGFLRGILFQRASSESQFAPTACSQGWANGSGPHTPTEVMDRIRGAALLGRILQGEDSLHGIGWAASLLGSNGDALLYLEFSQAIDRAQQSELLDLLESLRQAMALL